MHYVSPVISKLAHAPRRRGRRPRMNGARVAFGDISARPSALALARLSLLAFDLLLGFLDASADCFGKLLWAGVTAVASDVTGTAYDVLGLHAFSKAHNCVGVTVATAYDFNVEDVAVNIVEADLICANLVCCLKYEMSVHFFIPFRLIQPANLYCSANRRRLCIRHLFRRVRRACPRMIPCHYLLLLYCPHCEFPSCYARR